MLKLICVLSLVPMLLICMYAMDDYLELREMEKLPSNALVAQGFVKNAVVNGCESFAQEGTRNAQ